MKTLLALFFSLLFVPYVTAQNNEGINFFEGTWQETLDLAKKENKLIFFDAYTSWCGPCIRMAKNVFPQKKVGDFYNEHFISVKVDMEKGEGVELAKTYGVRVYPTLIFIDSEGDVVHRSAGGKQANELIELGKTALDDTKNLRALNAAYLIDTTNIDNLMAYAKALKVGYDKRYVEIIDNFLADKSDDFILTNEGWQIFNEFVENYSSNEFRFFVDNLQKFEKRFGEKEVDAKMHEILWFMIFRASRYSDNKKIEEAKKFITEINPPRSIRYYHGLADFLYGQRVSDWELYAQGVFDYLLSQPNVSIAEINRYTKVFYDYVDNEEHLNKMIDLIREAIKDADDIEYSHRKNYASLLYKIGKYEEALREANIALELSRNENIDLETLRELIFMIEKAMPEQK